MQLNVQLKKSHYFLPFSGQKLTKSQEEALANLDENAKLTDKIMVKYRRLIGILIPFIFFQVCWWCLAFKHDYFTLFPDRYILSLTMVLGATVAGKNHVKIKLHKIICMHGSALARILELWVLIVIDCSKITVAK